MKSQNLLKKKKSLFVDLAGLFPKFCLMIQKNKKKILKNKLASA